VFSCVKHSNGKGYDSKGSVAAAAAAAQVYDMPACVACKKLLSVSINDDSFIALEHAPCKTQQQTKRSERDRV
jgi:hypothetical protein